MARQIPINFVGRSTAPGGAPPFRGAPRDEDLDDSTFSNMTRQLSVVSSRAVEKLEDLERKFQDMQSHVEEITLLSQDSAMPLQDLLRAKLDLAQTLGQLDKFQFEQVDAVLTSELHSGKDMVKEQRKGLTHRISALRAEVERLYQYITERTAAPQDQP